MRNLILVALLVLFSINGVTSAAEDDVFEVEAEGSYRMEAGDPIQLAQKVALFIAKRKAVDLAGRYLSRKSLIAVYELNRDEIYSLAAREIDAKILKENRQTVGRSQHTAFESEPRSRPPISSKQRWWTPNRKKKRKKSLIKKRWNNIFLLRLIRGETSPKLTGCYEKRNGESR